MEAFGANGDNQGMGLYTEAGRRRMVVGRGMMMGAGEGGKGWYLFNFLSRGRKKMWDSRERETTVCARVLNMAIAAAAAAAATPPVGRASEQPCVVVCACV